MHEEFKGVMPDNVDDFTLNVAEIAEGADVEDVRRRAQKLKNHYSDALVLKSGGVPSERVQETVDRGTEKLPPSAAMDSLGFESDFYLYDKASKTFISIDNLDQLAQGHLKNAAKRFGQSE